MNSRLSSLFNAYLCIPNKLDSSSSKTIESLKSEFIETHLIWLKKMGVSRRLIRSSVSNRMLPVISMLKKEYDLNPKKRIGKECCHTLTEASNLPMSIISVDGSLFCVTGDISKSELLRVRLETWKRARPDHFSWFSSFVDIIHLDKFDYTKPDSHGSCSMRHLIGWMSLYANLETVDQSQFQESMRHECLHNVIYVWEYKFGTLWRGDKRTFISPWTGKVLDGDQFTHAMLVWLTLGLDLAYASNDCDFGNKHLIPFKNGDVKRWLLDNRTNLNENFDIEIDNICVL